MQRQGDAAVMEVIVSTAVAMVPGAEEASISLTQGRRQVVSAVATGELPRRFDDLQEETRQGPCMDAMYEHETIRVDDLPSERRWPELARRIPELGVASTMCFQLFVAGESEWSYSHCSATSSGHPRSSPRSAVRNAVNPPPDSRDASAVAVKSARYT